MVVHARRTKDNVIVRQVVQVGIPQTELYAQRLEFVIGCAQLVCGLAVQQSNLNALFPEQADDVAVGYTGSDKSDPALFHLFKKTCDIVIHKNSPPVTAQQARSLIPCLP